MNLPHPTGKANKFRDLTGQHFGRLVVIAYAGVRNHRCYWQCACECGNTIMAITSNLKRGNTRSCGCLSSETARARRTTHGKCGTPVYTVWQSMLDRCGNPRDAAFPNYGGRGIVVCDRWRVSFENFLADMGEPIPGMTLERIDNDKGYSPDNCRWATRKAQTRNTRRNHLLTHNGETHCIAEWAEIVGLSQDVIGERINRRGWSVERALTTPLRRW